MWGGLEVRALAPSTPVTVPVTAIGLQLVGLNVKPGTIDTYVDVLDLQRDPIEDRRGTGQRYQSPAQCEDRYRYLL